MEHFIESFTITSPNEHNTRIDHVLATKYPDRSRSFFTRLINDGLILVNQIPCKKAGLKVYIGDSISLNRPEKKIQNDQSNTYFKEVPTLIFEHEQFLVVNKPAGLLTHQANQYDIINTLVDWLLIHYPELGAIGYQGRPGIVHRLDKDTSGLLIIPKTTPSHLHFANAFKNRAITKQYIAIVSGTPETHGIIDFSIGRNPHQKTKMKAFIPSDNHNIKTREAKTEFFTKTYYQNAALLLVKPTTGRTHQIRVHLATHGHPIIGDTVYGTHSLLINRHALHAQALSFEFQNQQFHFESELPEDMQVLITKL